MQKQRDRRQKTEEGKDKENKEAEQGK